MFCSGKILQHSGLKTLFRYWYSRNISYVLLRFQRVKPVGSRRFRLILYFTKTNHGVSTRRRYTSRRSSAGNRISRTDRWHASSERHVGILNSRRGGARADNVVGFRWNGAEIRCRETDVAFVFWWISVTANSVAAAYRERPGTPYREEIRDRVETSGELRRHVVRNALGTRNIDRNDLLTSPVRNPR